MGVCDYWPVRNQVSLIGKDLARWRLKTVVDLGMIAVFICDTYFDESLRGFRLRRLAKRKGAEPLELGVGHDTSFGVVNVSTVVELAWVAFKI